MEKQVEKKDNLEVVITVKCDGDEWAKAVKKEFNKRAAKVTVPGFRPGKAPANMIKQRVNQAEVLNDAMLKVANEGYREALNEGKYYVFSEPKLSVSKISEKELECAITFCLPPEVTLGEYKHLGVDCKAVKVTAKDVNEYIDNLKKQHAVMQVKEGAAKKGDTVIIDFVGYMDGKAFDGGSANGYELELGSNSFIPGFEDGLVGVKTGERKSLTLTFPENYVEALKGKEATFDVTVQDVKEKVLPTVDEEFIKELNIASVTDEASLKNYAKEQVKSRKEQDAKNAQMEEIINKSVDNASVKIPSSMIEEESNAMLVNIKKQIEQAGLTWADYVAINGLKEEELTAARNKEAEKNIKAMLVTEKIMAVESIQVTDALLEKEYKRMADLYKMDVAKVREALEPNKEQLVRQLRNRYFSDFMLKHNEKLEVTAPATEEKAPAKKAAAKKTTTKKATEAKTTAKKTTTSKTTTAKKTTTKKAVKKTEETK